MRIRTLLIPLVMAGALLAGCTSVSPTTSPTPTTNGVEALEADQILDKATEALKAAQSFRFKGPASSGAFSYDLDIVFKGDDAKGSIQVLGISLEAVKVGGAVYLKAPETLWTTLLPADQQAVIAQFTGKYVKVPTVLVAAFIPTVDDLLEPSGTLTKGDIVTVDGKQAITLKDSDGSELHVSLEGQPYPIDIVAIDGRKVTFTEIDADVTIEAPAAADVFDLTALM
jgi:hypothetical protein